MHRNVVVLRNTKPNSASIMALVGENFKSSSIMEDRQQRCIFRGDNEKRPPLFWYMEIEVGFQPRRYSLMGVGSTVVQALHQHGEHELDVVLWREM